jgi:hypothetical protein
MINVAAMLAPLITCSAVRKRREEEERLKKEKAKQPTVGESE